MSAPPQRATGAISVVIPTRDAAQPLGRTLTALLSGPDAAAIAEVLVVDGGSRDDTRAVAQGFGARVIDAPPGRGPQLRTGAAQAGAAWLLVLHADSCPDPGWAAAIAPILARPGGDVAAVFRLRLDDGARVARLLERGVAWRTRALGLPYGDQGLLIARGFYEALGGYRDLPLMEDVDLVRRIGRRRIVALNHAVTTSAVRYVRDGYARRVARNLSILGLYFLGVSPARLVRLYG
ncbi:MAG: TIGR04283 family arsenosugar biosynthesis glycosyltransferase [Alkalilacustris sp.]